MTKSVYDLTNPNKNVLVKSRECYCDIENDILPALGGKAAEMVQLIIDLNNKNIPIDLRKLKDPSAPWDVRVKPDFVRSNIVKVKV